MIQPSAFVCTSHNAKTWGQKRNATNDELEEADKILQNKDEVHVISLISHVSMSSDRVWFLSNTLTVLRNQTVKDL